MKVNRSLKDPAMDDIDHALGRPLDPMTESYRNYYATNGALADAMAASPHWEESGRDSRLRFFHVTPAGRQALSAHLREIGDPHRAFTVTFDGRACTIVAISAGKARYRHFSDARDVFPDLTFKDFCLRSSVRAA